MDVETLLEELRRVVAGQAEPMTVGLEEAARRLSVSASTVRRLVRSGQLLTVRIGGRVMVPMGELRRLASPTEAPKRVPAPAGPPKSQREGIRALTRR